MRVSEHRISTLHRASERAWKIAILATLGTLGAASQADAALYYWNSYDPSYYQPEPQIQSRRSKPRKPTAKVAAPEKETGAKPQAPLVITISIQDQKMRVFDANGLFAESPVSTGMKGHSTPMGVFSVIQKHKFHHSNIYSGAPMPYKQRITSSGVAMHAGVLPGYPASHGCIRMPMAFAIKMWNWTKMGARVIVTPGEIAPAAFSHPMLATQKVAPQPVAEEPKVDAPLGVKGDKGAEIKQEDGLKLRTTMGHGESPTSLREQTHTADASGALPADRPSLALAGTVIAKADEVLTSEATGTAPDGVKAETETAFTKTAAATASDVTPNDGAVGESKSGDASQMEITASTEASKTEVGAGERLKAETTAEAVKQDAPKVDAANSAEPKAAEQPADASKPGDAPVADAKKDASRLPAPAKLDQPKRTGQIAVLISRKDSKLYVRQNFAPLFEAPVVIAPGDRPLGTHVFTAQVDKSDPNVLRWSVVSLPTARTAVRLEEDAYPARRHRAAGALAEVKPQPIASSPAEALDRITVPPDAMARVNEALTTGGSIIVSDQGINQGETGEGTDFIIPLR